MLPWKLCVWFKELCDSCELQYNSSSSLLLSHTNPSGPPIITADATQQAVKHSKGKLECLVGSSPPPDKIVSTLSCFCLYVCVFARCLRLSVASSFAVLLCPFVFLTPTYIHTCTVTKPRCPNRKFWMRRLILYLTSFTLKQAEANCAKARVCTVNLRPPRLRAIRAEQRWPPVTPCTWEDLSMDN